jgi:hypothetical protein
MNQYSEILEQFRGFVEQHVPADMLPNGSQLVAGAIALVGAGVLLSVLGARMARSALALVALLGGVAGGFRLSAHLGWDGRAQVLLIVATALGAALVGYYVYRIWVGAIVAALFAVGGALAFNHARLLPALANFDHPAYVATRAGAGKFAVPEAAAQSDEDRCQVCQWVGDFVSDLKARDPGVVQSVTIAALTWGCVGLLLGVLLTRMMLVLCTSAIGTALFAGGAALLAQQLRPNDYAHAMSRPGTLGLAIGACFLASVILQMLLTRRAPARPTPATSQ